MSNFHSKDFREYVSISGYAARKLRDVYQQNKDVLRHVSAKIDVGDYWQVRNPISLTAHWHHEVKNKVMDSSALNSSQKIMPIQSQASSRYEVDKILAELTRLCAIARATPEPADEDTN